MKKYIFIISPFSRAFLSLFRKSTVFFFVRKIRATYDKGSLQRSQLRYTNYEKAWVERSRESKTIKAHYKEVNYAIQRMKKMETRVAVMSIIIEKWDSVDKLNSILHDYAEYIIGRMGIPYKAKNINVICIALDAPQDISAALSGKVGALDGVSVKTAYSRV